MKRIALLILIAVVAISSAEAQKVKRTKHKEKDGFKWYMIEQGGNVGAEIEKNFAIIPTDYGYSNVSYIGNGCFAVGKQEGNGKAMGAFNRRGKMIIAPDYRYRAFESKLRYVIAKSDDGWRVCDTDGFEFIPIDRQYDSVVCTGTNFLVRNNGWGACNKYGREIIPVNKQYKKIIYFDGTMYSKGQWITYFPGGYFKVKSNRNYYGAFDNDGKMILSIDSNYTEYQYRDNYWIVKRYTYINGKVLKTEGVCKLLTGTEVISPKRGYTSIIYIYNEGHRYFKCEKDNIGDYGICDIYGVELIKPDIVDKGQIIFFFDNTFLHIDSYGIKHYYGVTLDEKDHGVPDPKHPAGTTDRPVPTPNPTTTTTQQNTRNNTYTNTYQPPAQNYTPTPSYNNRSTTPQQNNTTQHREKCKYCMGSGRCQGLNSPGGTRTIKMHCNGSGRCSTCGGKGLMSDGFGSQIKCSDCSYTGKCRFCKGTGKCDRCGGTGYR